MLDLLKARGSKLKIRLEPSGIELDSEGDQTILDRALAAELFFPHSCTVGSCTSCKSRLVTGKIKELSDVAYVLSEEEISEGMILACQSVPLTDITIQVNLE